MLNLSDYKSHSLIRGHNVPPSIGDYYLFNRTVWDDLCPRKEVYVGLVLNVAMRYINDSNTRAISIKCTDGKTRHMTMAKFECTAYPCIVSSEEDLFEFMMTGDYDGLLHKIDI